MLAKLFNTFFAGSIARCCPLHPANQIYWMKFHAGRARAGASTLAAYDTEQFFQRRAVRTWPGIALIPGRECADASSIPRRVPHRGTAS
jgi:hypothetical protein